MVFLTVEETRDLARRFGVLDQNGMPTLGRSASRKLDISNLKFRRLLWLANGLVRLLAEFDRAVLWVTDSGVWPSSENLHLYYRLRQSYGDSNIVENAPGHLFLRHEVTDMVSFVQLSILNAWDVVLFTSQDYGRIFVSHDEWIAISSQDVPSLEEFSRQLAEGS